jgi:hypothetical protein
MGSPLPKAPKKPDGSHRRGADFWWITVLPERPDPYASPTGTDQVSSAQNGFPQKLREGADGDRASQSAHVRIGFSTRKVGRRSPAALERDGLAGSWPSTIGARPSHAGLSRAAASASPSSASYDVRRLSCCGGQAKGVSPVSHDPAASWGR